MRWTYKDKDCGVVDIQGMKTPVVSWMNTHDKNKYDGSVDVFLNLPRFAIIREESNPS